MIDILFSGVLPIFAIAAIGYAMGRRGLFSSADAGVINRLIFLIAVPALNFRVMAHARFSEFDWLLLGGYFAAELLIYLLVFAVARFWLKCDVKESILLGFAAAFGNHILFVYPISLNLFGEVASLPIIAIVVLDNFAIFGGTMILMEALNHERFSLAQTLRNILTHPPLMAMAIGMLVALFALELPHGVNAFINFTSHVAAPCALFSLGVILADMKAMERVRASSLISGAKLFLMPLLAGGILTGLMGYDLGQINTTMMVATAPCGAMAMVLGSNYGVRLTAIAPSILISTLASIFTVSLAAAL